MVLLPKSYHMLLIIQKMVKMNQHVVIIGAGVVGVMCALESQRLGMRVTLIDPGEPGGEQAASYGNAGWLSAHSVIPPSEPGMWKKVPGFLIDPLGPLSIRPAYLLKIMPWLWKFISSTATPKKVEKIATALRTLLQDAPMLHQQVAAEAGLSDLIKATSGVMHVYRSRQQFLADSFAWRVRKQLGVNWQEFDEDALHAREPFLSREYKWGVLLPESGHCINPGAYVRGVASHLVANGAHIVQGTATGFEFDQSSLKSVVWNGGKLVCDKAVIAAGAHSAVLAQASNTKVLLETERGYHVAVDAREVGPMTPVMIPEHKVIVTMTDKGPRIAGQVEFAGLKAPADWRRADILKQLLYKLFPPLPVYSNQRYHHWMGHRPSSPDGMPYIGYANQSQDVVLAFGHGHVGLSASAKTGRVVGQLLTGREPEISLDPFSPTRFN